MPAKQQYLSGFWKRLSKVTAAIFASYVATMLLHSAILKNLTNQVPMLLTSAYSGFIVWIAFMILAFYIKKAWHVWGLYTLISLVSAYFIFM